MKHAFKIVTSLILSLLIISSGVLLTWASEENDIEETVTDVTIEESVPESIDEEKIYCNALINENFSNNSLIVTMKNNVSLQFDDYDIDDFSEINVTSVKNLSPYTYESVKSKYEAILAGNIELNDTDLLPTNYNYLLNKSNEIESNLTSYLNDSNIISLLNSKIGGVSLFDAETKQIEFKRVLKNYIDKLEETYEFLKDYDYSDYHLRLKLTLDTDSKQDVIDAIHVIEERDDVLYVSPNYYFEFDSVPDDEYVSDQWYLDRIDYFDALEYTGDTETVTVGILDSGINSSNPDLYDNLDFDLSKSFVDDEPFTDTQGHGTSVAGIIGACTNNEIGIAGIGSDVNLVSLKVGIGAQADLDAVALALDYAEINGIDLVNCSFGTKGYSLDSFTDMEEMYGDYSGVIVCSSGNDSLNIDNMGNFYYFPSALDYDNIISVAAIDENDDLISYSNYGNVSVDLAAPGNNIYTTSTDQSEGYRSFSGTSAAAPIVTGVIALIKSVHPDITNSQLRTFILNNVDVVDNLDGKVATGGIVNANNILSAINQKKFTIEYDANGGTGDIMDSSTVYYGVNKKLNSVTYTKLDYRFVGWTAHRASDNKWLYTDQNGNNGWYVENSQPDNYVKFVYNNCAKVAKTTSVNNDIVTMYAQWEALSLGDVNLDGRISIEDATLLQKYLTGSVEFSEQQERLADVNLDGRISIIDVTEIQKIVAGL